jgi:hypothetical protein
MAKLTSPKLFVPFLVIGAVIAALSAFGPFCVVKMRCLSTDEMVAAALGARYSAVSAGDPDFSEVSRKYRTANPVYLNRYKNYRRGVFGETRVVVVFAERYSDGSVSEKEVVARVSKCGRVDVFPEVMGGARYETMAAWLRAKQEN